MAKIQRGADGYYHTREYGKKPMKKERRDNDKAQKEFEVCRICTDEKCKATRKCIERHREQFIREGKLPVSAGDAEQD